MKKKALITGVTGQDGAYLTQLLLEKGYKVFGATRRSSSLNLSRLKALGLADDVVFVMLDMSDYSNLLRVIDQVEPHEIYNLGGQSSPQASFQQPIYTAETTGMGPLRLLEAVKLINPSIRVFEASSSEIFGGNRSGLVDETHDFYPKSPYGVAKLLAFWSVVNFREAYDLHASNGIMFNHESPLRGMEFVTRKITTTLAQIACGHQQVLRLGNLDNARDWGFAGDYVKAMWSILQNEKSEDFIIATGRLHTVRDFVEVASQVVGLDLIIEGEGKNAVGLDRKSGKRILEVHSDFYRPSEPSPIQGNAKKARRILSWEPQCSFTELVTMMAEADLARAREGMVWF